MYVVSSKELGSLFNDSIRKNLALMAAILTILSVSRECIGILNIFYKKVFRSAPLRRGDRLILRSLGPVKSVSVLYVYCVCTVTVLSVYSVYLY